MGRAPQNLDARAGDTVDPMSATEPLTVDPEREAASHAAIKLSAASLLGRDEDPYATIQGLLTEQEETITAAYESGMHALKAYAAELDDQLVLTSGLRRDNRLDFVATLEDVTRHTELKRRMFVDQIALVRHEEGTASEVERQLAIHEAKHATLVAQVTAAQAELAAFETRHRDLQLELDAATRAQTDTLREMIESVHAKRAATEHLRVLAQSLITSREELARLSARIARVETSLKARKTKPSEPPKPAVQSKPRKRIVARAKENPA